MFLCKSGSVGKPNLPALGIEAVIFSKIDTYGAVETAPIE